MNFYTAVEHTLNSKPGEKNIIQQMIGWFCVVGHRNRQKLRAISRTGPKD